MYRRCTILRLSILCVCPYYYLLMASLCGTSATLWKGKATRRGSCPETKMTMIGASCMEKPSRARVQRVMLLWTMGAKRRPGRHMDTMKIFGQSDGGHYGGITWALWLINPRQQWRAPRGRRGDEVTRQEAGDFLARAVLGGQDAVPVGAHPQQLPQQCPQQPQVP